MGTLFWQLNDCWPGVSWSVLDYYGHEKPAMEVVKAYYKPIIAVAEEMEDSLAVFIVSDLIKKSEVKLLLSIKTKAGALIWHFEGMYQLRKNSVLPLSKWPLKNLLKGHSKQDVLLEVRLLNKGKEIFMDEVRFVPKG